VNPLSITLPAIAAADQAVYYDPTLSTGWFDAASATKLHDALDAEGFATLDATQLAEFMQAHVTSKTPSVVVMAQDQIPETVVSLVTNDAGDQVLDPVGANHLVRKYMDAGGRVIHIGDWPFYNVALLAGGTLPAAPQGAGATTILGINGAGGADTSAVVQLSDVATAMGLAATFPSRRPTAPTNVDVVLARTPAGADEWIKLYPNNQGTGAFIRVVDAAPVDYDPNVVTDDEVADVVKLAKFSGLIPGGAPVTGCKGDADGNGSVDISDAVAQLRHITGVTALTGQNLTNANVNGGEVDVTDVVLVLQTIVGIPNDGGISLTCAGGGGGDLVFNAAMNAANEIPAPSGNPQATGTAMVTVMEDGSSVALDVTTTGEFTSNVTAAHIHIITQPNNTGPVVFGFFSAAADGAWTGHVAKTFTAANFPAGGVAGIATYEDAIAMLRAGKGYVNIHTGTNGAGEIRGNLVQ
jgi:hypothetical protein